MLKMWIHQHQDILFQISDIDYYLDLSGRILFDFRHIHYYEQQHLSRPHSLFLHTQIAIDRLSHKNVDFLEQHYFCPTPHPYIHLKTLRQALLE